MGRRVIAIIIALLVALFGVVGVVAYAQAADNRAVAGQATQSVFIAKAEVPMGTTAADAINQQLIALQKVVAKGVPQGALKTVTPDIAKLVATSAIMPGEVVLASRFGNLATQALSRAVPDGMVAVTLQLADPNRIAPLLAPGSHIIIYDTFNARDPKAKDLLPNGEHLTDKPEYVHATKVLLDDVEVIAVGDVTVTPAPEPSANADGQQKQGDEVTKALVTVAVTPEQSLRLIHTIQTGELYAALRGADVKIDRKSVVDDNSVVKR